MAKRAWMCAVAILAVACSPKPSPSDNTAKADAAPTSPAVKNAATEPAGDFSVPGAARPAGPVLSGTTWQLGNYTFQFGEPPAVNITSPELAAISPEGVTGSYRIHGKTIEIELDGVKRTGTFDGATLTIEGKPAAPVPNADPRSGAP